MLRLAAFRARYLRLIDVRLQRDCFARGHASRGHGTSNGIASADSCCNLFCEFLAVRNSLGVRSFGWISKKTAFHKHCRNIRLPQNVVTPAAHSAISRGGAANDVIMDG